MGALAGDLEMAELLKHPRYRIGDQLQPRFRGPRWVGTVTDARGSYSPTGHVLYNVRVPLDPEPVYLLLREEEVAEPRILADFADSVHRLLESPKAQRQFRSRRSEYLQARAHDTDRLPPIDLLRSDKSPPLNLPEKYALLAALHAAMHTGEEQLELEEKPTNLTWEEFAERDFEGYKNEVRWAALVNQVKEWLGPDKADAIQEWVDAVRADLQKKHGPRSRTRTRNGAQSRRPAKKRMA
jgi:hypothetical protein